MSENRKIEFHDNQSINLRWHIHFVLQFFLHQVKLNIRLLQFYYYMYMYMII